MEKPRLGGVFRIFRTTLLSKPRAFNGDRRRVGGNSNDRGIGIERTEHDKVLDSVSRKLIQRMCSLRSEVSHYVRL